MKKRENKVIRIATQTEWRRLAKKEKRAPKKMYVLNLAKMFPPDRAV
jgi:hypothetical protein